MLINITSFLDVSLNEFNQCPEYFTKKASIFVRRKKILNEIYLKNTSQITINFTMKTLF